MRKILILSLIILLLASCKSPEISGQQIKEVPNSADIEQNMQMSSPWEIPKPQEGKGIISGIAVDKDNLPVGEVPIFLSKELTSGNENIPPTISFSLQNDIRAIMNTETGEFYFPNVPPAENYVITVVNGPGEFYVARKSNSDEVLVIKIDANSVLDLGRVVIKEP